MDEGEPELADWEMILTSEDTCESNDDAARVLLNYEEWNRL